MLRSGTAYLWDELLCSRAPSGFTSCLSHDTRAPGGNDNNDIVVALIDLGISKKVAQYLAGQYNPEKITEKIGYLAFLEEQQPERVKNPCGWLMDKSNKGSRIAVYDKTTERTQ